jgi:hypothetical protein
VLAIRANLLLKLQQHRLLGIPATQDIKHCIGITKIDCGLSGRFCGPLKKTSLQRRVLIFVKTVYFMMLLQEPMLLALHFNQFQNVIYL